MKDAINTDHRHINILMVEDNCEDVLLTKEALEECNISNTLNVVSNGTEALAYLRGEDKYAGAIHPDVILLDLKLPGKNGLEVLAEIKGDDYLRHIPVIVLTTSTHETDIRGAYDSYANCYIVKPVDLHMFMAVIRAIEILWFSAAAAMPGDIFRQE
jgi:two-component system response regulator